ncbi:unnamed protein product [Soboliphyme baturini]|uniref:PH domain-containing protein n=1 Tax=Soboliphyme baturini TaxID=241478 RepID=A0A183IUZ7_9BILA|nr:unnamed protein product [Soboliphyme baturini]
MPQFLDGGTVIVYQTKEKPPRWKVRRSWHIDDGLDFGMIRSSTVSVEDTAVILYQRHGEATFFKAKVKAEIRNSGM